MKILQIQTTNLNEGYNFESLAHASNGAVFYTCGKSAFLATICVDSKQMDGDFVPLSVQYIQKAYAAGKFPAGFIKREGKPSEFEILTSRLIDRTLRPLFPKGYGYNTHIVVQTLSYDGECDLALCALRAASSALFVSNIGIKGVQKELVSAVRIGRVDGEFIINPNRIQREKSTLDLFVSGKGDELLMIEMNSIAQNESANLLSEELTLQALELAKQSIKETCARLESAFMPFQKPSMQLELKQEICTALEFLRAHCEESVKEAIKNASKSERADAFDEIIAFLVAHGFELEDSKRSLGVYKRALVREMILQEKRRADGRGLENVREISIETNLLPCAHGSALFTRGQTQALVVCTLGGENDAQIKESLSQNILKEKFLFHYNFPPFSVGETDMIGSPGRRELGHGNLARKALGASIAPTNNTIRLVSEILESNGSSSMASVCGGSLALYASGVEMYNLIAGVAMGLVSEGEKYAILSDITGLEDHDGDMDFKVAGDEWGISALQMDIKLGGIQSEILYQALLQAKRARAHILGIMKEALKEIKPNYDILPKSESFAIAPQKIVLVIGSGGKMIKSIIERFGVSIDLERESGIVRINGANTQNIAQAKEFILNLIKEVDFSAYKIGTEFVGKIKRVLDFGAFVELPNGGDGLVHISKISDDKTKRAQDFFTQGQELKCVIVGINKDKVELDIR
ncbi:polyribonucleotide nucleotidyltransferase [Helicobacter himalayensis]|uniref:polyribonucleotide nucleotidyltransferase n=1 Tax=Helicobacter himalayensis TaxID=1591088 RepID=UPI000831861D|nr:polyribonucleotide nucleotidyltransferase [Helicobacter himalayensis]